MMRIAQAPKNVLPDEQRAHQKIIDPVREQRPGLGRGEQRQRSGRDCRAHEKRRPNGRGISRIAREIRGKLRSAHEAGEPAYHRLPTPPPPPSQPHGQSEIEDPGRELQQTAPLPSHPPRPRPPTTPPPPTSPH